MSLRLRRRRAKAYLLRCLWCPVRPSCKAVTCLLSWPWWLSRTCSWTLWLAWLKKVRRMLNRLLLQVLGLVLVSYRRNPLPFLVASPHITWVWWLARVGVLVLVGLLLVTSLAVSTLPRYGHSELQETVWKALSILPRCPCNLQLRSGFLRRRFSIVNRRMRACPAPVIASLPSPRRRTDLTHRSA